MVTEVNRITEKPSSLLDLLTKNLMEEFKLNNNNCYSVAIICCIYAPSLSYSLKPLISFVVLHFRLMFDGRTTKERMSRIYEEFSKNGKISRKSPFHQGWYENCAKTFFEPEFTSFFIHTPHKSEIVRLISCQKLGDVFGISERMQEPVAAIESVFALEKEYII
uniref:Uncharacterized protein n=1 Tax=Romanomermis culicivorax TaxID=13658 RepID=A0A915IKD4_ROMCU